MPLSDWERSTSTSALDDHEVKTLKAMFRYHDRNGAKAGKLHRGKDPLGR